MTTGREVRLVSVTTSTITDQAGLPQLALVGLDAWGMVWKKLGDGEWQLIDMPIRPARAVAEHAQTTL